MPYYDLTDINLSDEPKTAKLSCNHTATGESFDGCYLQKFRIQTQTFPVYVPQLTVPSESSKLKLTMTYTDTTNTSTWNDGFYADYTVCVLNTTNNQYSSQPMKWIPQKHLNLKPGSNQQTRYATLTNPYFYCYNSIHLLKMLQETIKKCLVDVGIDTSLNKVLFVKDETTYQLLIQDTLDIKIFFNYSLTQAFNFYYSTNWLSQAVTNAGTNGYQEVVFDTDITTYLFDKTFYVSQILSLTTRIFPFSDIQFSSMNINAEQINVLSSQSLNSNLTIPIIFSYSLNISDIDEIADNFNYTAQSEFRKTSITSRIQNFDIYVYFKTFDGYLVQLSLNKYDSINLLLQFV